MRDSRRSDGLRPRCRACHAADQRDRAAGRNPRPGALILAPTFPAPPPEDPLRAAEPTDTYAAAVEATLGKLQPPPGPLDAPLVAGLRDLARRLDGGYVEPRDVGTLQTRMVALLRELKATRASAGEAAPRPASKLDAFRASAS